MSIAAAKKIQANNDLTTIQEEILSEMTLPNFLNLDNLQQAQRDLAEISNLAIVTVDSKGIPVTKETNFTDFCALGRTDETFRRNCFFSDAYGGLKATMNEKPYVYLCPAGLMDCAVPINFHGHYLGAVLIGQVRCAPEDCPQLERIKCFIEGNNSNLPPQMQEAYNQLPVLRLREIKMVTTVFYMYVREMVEKQIEIFAEKRLLSEQEILNRELKETRQQAASAQKIGREDVPQVLLSIMNSIGNISAMEGASHTNELVCIYAEMLEYIYSNTSEYVSLSKELEFSEDYLKVQMMCLPGVFEYQIDKNCSLDDKSIPHLLLFTFVENAVEHGVVPRNFGGKIQLSIQETGDDYWIIVSDNGNGMKNTDFKRLRNSSLLRVNHDDSLVKGLNIDFTRKKLNDLFGNRATIEFENNFNRGFTAKIKLPKYIEES